MDKTEDSLKPNMFIVGAARCGTTSLANYISQHPDIFISHIKEPKFFSLEDDVFPHNGPYDREIDKKVIKDISTYESLFSDGQNYKIRGEASVNYLYFPGVAQRIYEYNPNAKIIISLRNPVERAFSAYYYMLRSNREYLDFNTALNEEQKRKSANWEFIWYYREGGFYSEQVKRYIELFGREQVMVILIDDLISNTISTLQEVFHFLKVSKNSSIKIAKLNISGTPKWRWIDNFLNTDNYAKRIIRTFIPKAVRKNINSKVTNANLVKTDLDINIRKSLTNEYVSDILNLQNLIRRDLSHWLT